jgi:hypothetical protein
MENEVALKEDFLPALLLLPLSIIRPMLHVHTHILTLFLSEGQAGKTGETSNTTMLPTISGSILQESTYRLFSFFTL